MLVTIVVAMAAIAVLAAIVVVAVGKGGELSTEHPDHPPLTLPSREVAGTDAALLRLPLGLWGYHKQITDEALERFAYELTERDTRIAVLEQELAETRRRLNGANGSDPEVPGERSWARVRDDVPSAELPALPRVDEDDGSGEDASQRRREEENSG